MVLNRKQISPLLIYNLLMSILLQGSNPYRASPLVRGSLHSSVFDPISTQLHSPKSLGSPQMASPLGLGNNSTEIQRLNEELMAAKTKLASWEESWVQAKQACDAWKKEAEESIKKAKQAEKDKLEAVIKKEEVISHSGLRVAHKHERVTKARSLLSSVLLFRR